MTVPDHLRVRDSRDRVIDLLGLGRTAPMRDVSLTPEGAVVPVDIQADLGIDPGQIDVRYILRQRDGSPVGSGRHVKGTGGPTVLRTPPVTVDVTYRVLARRIAPEGTQGREAFLHGVVELKAGIDNTLPARIVAPILGPGGDDSDPRIVHHGEAVDVEVDRSQPGVSYELIDPAADDVVSTEPVPGNQATIRLRSHPRLEDGELRVRASRDDGSTTAATVLEASLPLAVRADPGLEVNASAHVVEIDIQPVLTIEGTQESATYQVFGRSLTRHDFVYGPTDDEVVVVPVPAGPDVQITRPDSGTEPEDLSPMSAVVAGTEADLNIELNAIEDDTVLVVVATKNHGTGSSTVQLSSAAAVLVFPDRHRALSIVVPVTDGEIEGLAQVDGGQDGVSYGFRPTGAAPGDQPDHPVIFPEPDQAGEPVGIGTLRIGVDWHVGRAEVGRARHTVLPPPLPATYVVRATRLRTGVTADLVDSTVISAPPTIDVDENPVPLGSAARIVVRAGLIGERYRPYVGDEPVRPVRIGDGSDLVFLTDPLNEATTITIRIESPPDQLGPVVEKRVDIDIGVVDQ